MWQHQKTIEKKIKSITVNYSRGKEKTLCHCHQVYKLEMKYIEIQMKSRGFTTR